MSGVVTRLMSLIGSVAILVTYLAGWCFVGYVSGTKSNNIRAERAEIRIHPPVSSHVTVGSTLVLSCKASGSPQPDVLWFRNGQPIPRNSSRHTAFNTGYLIISQVEKSDAGSYLCYVYNPYGHTFARSQVSITDHESGCGDGTTDGLIGYEDIQACSGSWTGHVKRARNLCAADWHVCSLRDVIYLQLLTWTDVTHVNGCFAYNAANSVNKCTRCHREDMAGIGNKCGRVLRTHSSCLNVGRIDVFASSTGQTCDYDPRATSGVLCCRTPLTNQVITTRATCLPMCANGGVCTHDNRCRCQAGYKGAWCQNPICAGGCVPNSVCVRPGWCRCISGHDGPKCKRVEPVCSRPCLHGGRCSSTGKCKCAPNYHGTECQYWLNKTKQSTAI